MRTRQIKLPNGQEVSCLNRAEALHSHEEMSHYFQHGIRVAPNDVVVDVGANIGLFMLAVHWRCPTARVYSFEPIPYTFAALRNNAQRYDPLHLRVFNWGLSDQAGDVVFSFLPRMTVMSNARSDEMRSEFEQFIRELPNVVRHQPTALAWRLFAALPAWFRGGIMRSIFGWFTQAEQIRCRVRPLSEVLRELDIKTIDLLKIDVERAELDVLKGIEEQHWSGIRQVVAEIHDQDGRLEKIRTLLTAHGFERIQVDQEPQFKGTHIFHLFAVRQ